jgi:hypothetical protein
MDGCLVHKALTWIAAAAAVAALAGTLTGCDLPPVCGAFKAADDCVVLNHPPTVQLIADWNGVVPLTGQTVTFEAYAHDPDPDDLQVRFDMDGDGTYESRGFAADGWVGLSRVYSTPGVKQARVRVTDYPYYGGGEGSATATVQVRVYTPDEARSLHYPTASFTAAVSGLTVHVDASGSSAAAGRHLTDYRWYFDRDGLPDRNSSSPTADWTYPADGRHEIRLVVVDDQGIPSSLVAEWVTVAGGSCAPPTCGGGRASGTKPGLPFSARVKGGTLRAALLSHPGKQSWAERTLRGFLHSAVRLHHGLAVARAHAGSLLCLRVTSSIPAEGVPTGRIQTLGGTKTAARLRASGTFRFAGEEGAAVGVGTLHAGRGKRHPLSRACAKLARVRQG